MKAFAEVSEHVRTDTLCRECRETIPYDSLAFLVPGSEVGHYAHGDFICHECYADMDAGLDSFEWDEDGNGL